MSVTTDQGNGGQGQEPAGGTPQQGQEPAGQQGQQGQQSQGQEPGGHPQQFDPATIQDPATRAVVEKIIRDAEAARREAAGYRTKATEAETRAQQIARQNETEQERIQREAQERDARLQSLEQENRDLKVGTVLRDKATAAGAFSAQGVWDLVRARGIQVETDDKGTPTNTDAILAGLKASDPYLFKRAQGGGDAGQGTGAGQAPTGGAGMNDFIRGRAGRTVTR